MSLLRWLLGRGKGDYPRWSILVATAGPLLAFVGMEAWPDPRWGWLWVTVNVPVLARFRPDERFRSNLARAGLVGFCFAMLAIWVATVALALNPTLDLSVALMLIHLGLVYSFGIALWWYERRGV